MGKHVQREAATGKARAQKALAEHNKAQLRRLQAFHTVTQRGGTETDRNMMPVTGFLEVQPERGCSWEGFGEKE